VHEYVRENMQKDVILGCGNRSNAEMDTITLIHHGLHTIQTLVQTPISTALLFSFGQWYYFKILSYSSMW
jgi:hypothetical protein